MKVVTEAMKANFDRSWGLLTQLIEVCPEGVWNKKAGGFVFWQQLYHCFTCVDVFIMPKGGSINNPVAMFKAEPQNSMSRDELKKYASEMKAKADAWINSLDDSALGAVHEGCSERFGNTVLNAGVFTTMIGHSFYHIGSCDAILRDNGHKGVM